MADQFLVIIPSDPFADRPGNAEAVRKALERIAGSDESRVKDYGKLQFIDCGTNFQHIACPHCGSPVSEETWQGWMASDWHGEDGFHLHAHQALCCEESIRLNDLVYTAPQGFARWMISARTRDRGSLTEDELLQLEGVAGLPLRAIAQTY